MLRRERLPNQRFRDRYIRDAISYRPFHGTPFAACSKRHRHLIFIGTVTCICRIQYDEVIGDRNKINMKLHEIIGKTIQVCFGFGHDCSLVDDEIAAMGCRLYPI